VRFIAASSVLVVDAVDVVSPETSHAVVVSGLPRCEHHELRRLGLVSEAEPVAEFVEEYDLLPPQRSGVEIVTIRGRVRLNERPNGAVQVVNPS
jgi:hypothetical protein